MVTNQHQDFENRYSQDQRNKGSRTLGKAAPEEATNGTPDE